MTEDGYLAAKDGRFVVAALHRLAMRLLLLLTAFFTALTGVVTGASASPQAVQASASAEQARLSPVARIAPLLLKAQRRSPSPVLGTPSRTGAVTFQDRDTFGERRRE